MSCGIYKITNLINNKCYIGQSVNIQTRWRRHRAEASNENNCYPLYLAIRKYGIENFSFEILEECLKAELNNKERFWINFYNSFFDGYNQTLGGSNAGSSISLTSNEITEIIELLKETKLTNIEIANEYNVSENTICGINTGYYWFQDIIEYPIRKKLVTAIKKCPDCGKEISKNSKYCISCNGLRQRIQIRPDRDILKKMIRTTPFTKIGELYNVTDNSIRKWCKAYNLPFRAREIKQYSEEEWLKI